MEGITSQVDLLCAWWLSVHLFIMYLLTGLSDSFCSHRSCWGFNKYVALSMHAFIHLTTMTARHNFLLGVTLQLVYEVWMEKGN